MIVLAGDVFLVEDNWLLEFVVVRLETPPDSQHHIQHDVPVLVPEIYDIPPLFRRLGNIFQHFLPLVLEDLVLAQNLFPPLLG